MIDKILLLIAVTMFPFLELRASIPFGLWNKAFEFNGITLNGLALPLEIVFPIVIISNILLGILIFFLLHKFVDFFIQFNWINSLYTRIVLRTQRKAAPLVEKYGLIGVALFIAIPLPGSGVYTGALAAYLLGIDYKKFLIAETIGVLIAGTIITLLTIGVLNVPFV